MNAYSLEGRIGWKEEGGKKRVEREGGKMRIVVSVAKEGLDASKL